MTKSKLNPNALKWVKALESGKYKQGIGALHRISPDQFCCLGIACVVAIKAGVRVRAVRNGDHGKMIYGGKAGVLPRQVRCWLGLATDYAGFNNGSRSLANDNDSGKCFKTIAKIIRSKPEGLFSEPATNAKP